MSQHSLKFLYARIRIGFFTMLSATQRWKSVSDLDLRSLRVYWFTSIKAELSQTTALVGGFPALLDKLAHPAELSITKIASRSVCAVFVFMDSFL